MELFCMYQGLQTRLRETSYTGSPGSVFYCLMLQPQNPSEQCIRVVTGCVLCTWTASYFKSLLCVLRDKFHREICHLTKPSALCLISRGIPQLPICIANKFHVCIVSVDPHSAAGKRIILAKQDGEDLRRSWLVLLFQWGSTLTRRGQRRQAEFLSVLECHVHQKATAPVPPRV